jgi:hypothetical protein
MHARKNEREAMKDAVEMAVLSSVQHPNIVSVYSCLTDMVDVTGGLLPARAGPVRAAARGLALPPSAWRKAPPAFLKPSSSPNGCPGTLVCAPAPTCTSPLSPPELDDDGASMSSVGSSICDSATNRMRFRRLTPDEDPDGVLPTCNILVMEVRTSRRGAGGRAGRGLQHLLSHQTPLLNSPPPTPPHGP